MAKGKSSNFLESMAAFIVDKRSLFFLLYLFAIIFSVFSMGWVEVENDVTTYLPADTETRQGIVAMNENFVESATARIMVTNVTYSTAQSLNDQIAEVDSVLMSTFDDTQDHYRDASAVFDVTFADGATAQSSLDAMASIQGILDGYDAYYDTTIGYDENAMLAEEMTSILIVAVIIIIGVLVLTSRSYMEVPVLLLTFAAAAILNMGTNFLCGKISFISNSIAVVLQLALAIDYAIILCHRFTDERETRSARDAAVIALTKAIPEISASSLTTISGLAALGFMEFAIGLDMAVVLIKSILLSMLSVFTLMPGLLVLFSPLMDKTRHKSLVPDVSLLGKFAVKTRRIVPPLFLVVLIASFILSNNCPYSYSYNNLRTPKMTDRQNAFFQIQDTFGNNNMVALIVPSGDYEAESRLLQDLDAMPQVKSTMGLSGIEAMDGYKLTDSLTPRQLSEVLGMDYEVIQLLYSAYAADHSEIGAILSGVEDYEIPLFDMLLYLKDQMEANSITLPSDGDLDVDALLEQLDTAKNQMRSDKYSRMVVYLNLPEESQETFDFLSTIRQVAGKYYDGDYYVVGNSTSARDLSSSFVKDNLMISILSSFFVIIILLFTFQSAGLPLLLIAVIQGSIWINFSIPTLFSIPMYFLGYLIVQAIQMGANIDYAIVISSHYQELKKQMPHKQAIVKALNAAFPTVFTSGTILASAGMLIGNMSAQPVVSIMGTCIGRGTIISMILVLLVLPAFLVLGDSIIERTSFRIKGIEAHTHTASGTVHINGRVRGYVSGMIDGDFNGVLHGEMNANIATGGQLKEEEGGGEHA